MSTAVDKLIRANELILEVEQELLVKNKFVPYEIGNTLRCLEQAVIQVQKIEKGKREN